MDKVLIWIGFLLASILVIENMLGNSNRAILFLEKWVSSWKVILVWIIIWIMIWYWIRGLMIKREEKKLDYDF